MKSLLFITAVRLVFPLLMLFSLFLLLRGHNEPGGGFTGGLIAAAAIALQALARGVAAARDALPVPPRILIVAGLLLSGASGLPALAMGQPFLTAQWLNGEIPVIGKVGTPILFDAGVYLLVVGVATAILLTVMEGEEGS